MSSEKFHNTSITIKGLLGLIEAKDIAIPEIQRPFVWKNSQVRDLIDSLYKGYPTGYIILWKNPNVKLKDGTISSGKKVIIDGQQRITALMTAIAAQKVFNNEFKESRVKIAFNPFAALCMPMETVRQKCLLFKHQLISRVRIGFLIYQRYSVQNSLHGHSYQST